VEEGVAREISSPGLYLGIELDLWVNGESNMITEWNFPLLFH